MSLYFMTQEEYDLLKLVPNAAPAPIGVAGCGQRSEDKRFICTLMAGHEGPHVAHGAHTMPCAVWPEKA